MSNITHLLERYRGSAQVQSLTKALTGATDAPVRVQLSGLSGAQRAFVIAATAQKARTVSHLIIAESKEEAAYLQNDLEGLLGNIPLHFFPDSFKRPAFFDELNATQVLQRSEVVSNIGGSGGGNASLSRVNPTPNPSPGGEGSMPLVGETPLPLGGGVGGGAYAGGGINAAGITITYPEALFEKVVSPAVLAENRIQIVVGEKLDVDFVIEVLVEYGFERTDFVYEPGQFSIRGGIVDLFSWGNELPYRIELFDDEVESIRSFDPLTQLSSQKLQSINIIPNLNTRFRQDQKVSLLNVLPRSTVIWVKDFQFILDRLQFCFEKAEQFAGKISALDTAELREIFRDRAFLYPREVVEEVKERGMVFLEKQNKETTEQLHLGQ